MAATALVVDSRDTDTKDSAASTHRLVIESAGKHAPVSAPDLGVLQLLIIFSAVVIVKCWIK